MTETKLGDYSLTFEQALLELTKIRTREFEAQYKPNIQSVKTWVLKNGPRAYKAAVFWTFRDENTLEVHHNTLTIDTIRRQKINNQWVIDEKSSIKLSNDDGDQIGELMKGLATLPQIGGQR